MPTSKKQILEQNPLSLLFLSGFATEFFISLCYKDLNTECIDCYAEKKKSYKRMEKWQICFYQICKDLFNNNSFEDERKVIENMENNPSLFPYSLHSKLLVCYSYSLSSISDLGPNTRDKVNKWFDIIRNIRETSLWKLFFPREDKQELNQILLDYQKKNHSENIGSAKEYAHFSPMLLYVRSMYLIIIHQRPPCDKNDYSWNDFTDWSKYNALVIADLIEKDLLHTEITNGQISKFPYIHFLDVNKLFNIWEKNYHSSICVPVDKIFMQIVNQIYIKTIHYDRTMNIFVHNFRDTVIELGVTMMKLRKNMLNCEKQSKFQTKKRNKCMAEDVCMKLSTDFGEFWISFYIFPFEDVFRETEMYAC
jgi:hypothetical protein